MKKQDGLKPGQQAPFSGQYEELGPRGAHTGHEVTSEKGNPLPPTRGPNRTYLPVDQTKNKAGRGK